VQNAESINVYNQQTSGGSYEYLGFAGNNLFVKFNLEQSSQRYLTKGYAIPDRNFGFDFTPFSQLTATNPSEFIDG